METLIGIGVGIIVCAGLLLWGWWHYFVPYREKKLDDACDEDKHNYKWGA